MRDPHASEVDAGERFAFGRNWRHFLAGVDEERIVRAEESLKQMLDLGTLEGRSFLDIGSGSGLFSLAARRLGARVYSFDYDPDSVACTAELKDRYFPHDGSWTIETGSALDRAYLESLGKFDIVYSWGVLHHTGDMWRALDYARLPVEQGGTMFIAIYNDQGGASGRWRRIKRFYQKSPAPIRVGLVSAIGGFLALRSSLIRLVRFQNPIPMGNWRRGTRGMSTWYDLVDWVGGYPFEVARPEGIIDFFHARGLTLLRLRTVGSALGCNEFVFVNEPLPSAGPAAPGSSLRPVSLREAVTASSATPPA